MQLLNQQQIYRRGPRTCLLEPRQPPPLVNKRDGAPQLILFGPDGGSSMEVKRLCKGDWVQVEGRLSAVPVPLPQEQPPPLPQERPLDGTLFLEAKWVQDQFLYKPSCGVVRDGQGRISCSFYAPEDGDYSFKVGFVFDRDRLERLEFAAGCRLQVHVVPVAYQLNRSQ